MRTPRVRPILRARASYPHRRLSTPEHHPSRVDRRPPGPRSATGPVGVGFQRGPCLGTDDPVDDQVVYVRLEGADTYSASADPKIPSAGMPSRLLDGPPPPGRGCRIEEGVPARVREPPVSAGRRSRRRPGCASPGRRERSCASADRRSRRQGCRAAAGRPPPPRARGSRIEEERILARVREPPVSAGRRSRRRPGCASPGRRERSLRVCGPKMPSAGMPSARCNLATTGPRLPMRRSST